MGFWSDLAQGITEGGREVTAQFGEDSGNKGETLLSDGIKTEEEFTGKSGNRGHDHYDGKGGGTERGRYTGPGSKK